MKILVLIGPNLNMLGTRDPKIYGSLTLKDIQSLCEKTAQAHKATIDFRQSNHEGDLVTWIQEAITDFDGLIINAGAYTHTSIAIYDALEMVSCPIIEVHQSDPKSREEFRHHSYISPHAQKIITGQKEQGYVQAIEILTKSFKRPE
jgi:3-dehydroquinate dehydratase-2